MSTDQSTAPPSFSAPAAAVASGSRAAGLVLVGATIAMGLMAGLFFAFDVSVMPGLAAGDDRRRGCSTGRGGGGWRCGRGRRRCCTCSRCW